METQRRTVLADVTNTASTDLYYTIPGAGRGAHAEQLAIEIIVTGDATITLEATLEDASDSGNPVPTWVSVSRSAFSWVANTGGVVSWNATTDLVALPMTDFRSVRVHATMTSATNHFRITVLESSP